MRVSLALCIWWVFCVLENPELCAYVVNPTTFELIINDSVSLRVLCFSVHRAVCQVLLCKFFLFVHLRHVYLMIYLMRVYVYFSMGVRVCVHRVRLCCHHQMNGSDGLSAISNAIYSYHNDFVVSVRPSDTLIHRYPAIEKWFDVNVNQSIVIHICKYEILFLANRSWHRFKPKAIPFLNINSVSTQLNIFKKIWILLYVLFVSMSGASLSTLNVHTKRLIAGILMEFSRFHRILFTQSFNRSTDKNG